jgi:hypothetical protein
MESTESEEDLDFEEFLARDLDRSVADLHDAPDASDLPKPWEGTVVDEDTE